MIRLAYVPPPPADATVYSILAAAYHLMPDFHFTEKILGGGGVHVRPLWPRGLEAIANALPALSGLDAQTLLHKHTLVPLFLPFMDEPQYGALVRASLRLDSGEPFALSGSQAAITRPTPPLRVCLPCLRSSTPCWSRVHQAPGVVVCPHHLGEILHDTSVTRTPRMNRRKYVDVRDANVLGCCIEPLLANDMEKAHALATAMETLLRKSCAHPGASRFRAWLHERLRSAGFAGPFGKLNLIAETNAIADWVGKDLGSAIGIGSDWASVKSNWLTKILTNRRVAIHPLFATIPVLFLGVGIEEALNESEQFCSPEKPVTTPMHRGISPAHARFESGKKDLRLLWRNRSLSVRQIGKRLGVSDITVRRWAVNIGLPFPRVGPTNVVRAPRPRNVLQPFAARLREKQLRWLVAIKTLPRGRGVTRHPSTQRLYGWLARYAPTWLPAHLPKIAALSRIDWRERDQQLARDLITAAKEIRGSSNPTRVSKTRMIAEVGDPSLFSHLHEMPMCKAVIKRYSESHAKFIARSRQYLASRARMGDQSHKAAFSEDSSLRAKLTP